MQVVIFRKKASGLELLLLQTNKKRGEFWQNVTGSLEKVDREIIDGAFREVVEETTISRNLIQKFAQLPLEYQFRDQWGKDVLEFTFCFLIDESATIKLDEHEHQNYEWINADKVTKQHYKYPSNFEVFEAGLNWIKQHG